MPKKPWARLMLALLLVLCCGIGASSTSHASAPLQCGLYMTYYYSTGGHCNFFCNNHLSCFGNVTGTITSQVAGQCYSCA